MKFYSFYLLIFALLAFVLVGCSKAPIGKWIQEGQYPIEITVYKFRLDARWLHSNKTMSYIGSIKDNSFVGHSTLDSSLPDTNQATFLKDGSLEVHFLMRPNVVFKKATEQDAAANP